MVADIALYIHIPFCVKKCSYCSFVSYSGKQEAIERYSQALKKEIPQRIDGRLLKSVYFGGGTPSLIPVDCMESLMENISPFFSASDQVEVSLEANPGTVNTKYLKNLLRIGINRLSIGLQSLDDGELFTMGRPHNASEGLKAVKCARSAGFDNINLDLIYGIPGQTVSSWKQTLKGVLDLGLEHLSLYGLSLEAGTPMASSIEEGSLAPPDPDLSADLYEIAEDLLAGKGYRHYEISNWAKPGYECRHNLVYWKNQEYIGVGVAACSYTGGHRYSNTLSLDKYLEVFSGEVGEVVEYDETISPEMAAAEAAILSLRLEEGVEINSYNREYKTDILSTHSKDIYELESYGLLENDGAYIKLTPRGRLLGNEVFWRFLPASSGCNDPYQETMELK